MFRNTVKKYPNLVALAVKRVNTENPQPKRTGFLSRFQKSTDPNAKVWLGWSYADYYRDVIKFAKTLVALKITQKKSLNIIGFNAPEWAIAFYGSIVANVLPVGIYTTNTPDACHYISDHSEAEVVVAENQAQLEKYLSIWDKLPQLRYVVVWAKREGKIDYSKVPEERRAQVLPFWTTNLPDNKCIVGFIDLFMTIDIDPNANESERKVKEYYYEKEVNKRMDSQKPGSCATLVYTSGTTGSPKGVMLSHDNYSWLADQLKKDYNA